MLPRTADPQGFAHTAPAVPARRDLTVVEPSPVVVLDLAAPPCACSPPAPGPHRREDQWPCPHCGTYWRLVRAVLVAAAGRRGRVGEGAMIDDPFVWAHRTLAGAPDPRPSRRLARVEVGTALFDALRAASANPDFEDDPPTPDVGATTPHHTLFGVPLGVNEDLPPMAWRTFDPFDGVLDEGDETPMCEPFVCAYPDPRGYRWRARWACPRCGTVYLRGRRAPTRWWRNWAAPHGSWVLPWSVRPR